MARFKFTSPAYAPYVAQEFNIKNNNATTQTLTLNHAPAVGSLLLCLVTYKSANTIAVPAGYTRPAGFPYSANGYAVDCFTRVATGTAGDTCAVVMSAAGNISSYLREVVGAASVYASASSAGNNSNAYGPTIALTGPSLVIMVANAHYQATPMPLAGWAASWNQVVNDCNDVQISTTTARGGPVAGYINSTNTNDGVNVTLAIA